MKKLADHPMVGEARHCGLVGGVEVVADRKTKRPFEPSLGVGAMVAALARNHGLISRAIGDTIALCPPMIIKEDELNEMFDRLEKALDEAEAKVSKDGLRGTA
jgi:4-aminobutyrate--pyruvate transaminase